MKIPTPTPKMIQAGARELSPHYGGTDLDQVVRRIWDAMHRSRPLFGVVARTKEKETPRSQRT